MYTIKTVPEDFVVEELPIVEMKPQGKFVYFWLKKRDYTTLDAVQAIARQLHVRVEGVGVAGNKDKRAVTKQLCSVSVRYESALQSFQHERVQLEIVGYGDDPVVTGLLQGNHFSIIVRNTAVLPQKREWFVNFFGEQRFSSLNVAIGKALLQNDFKKAIELLHQAKTRIVLSEGNDVVQMLRSVPKKLLKLFVHAYQSQLWNEIVQELTKEQATDLDLKVPLPGFGFDGPEEIRTRYEQLLEKDHLSFNAFVIRQLPDISGEAQERNVWVRVPDLTISQKQDSTLLLTFTLPKGAYATEVVRQLFEDKKIV